MNKLDISFSSGSLDDFFKPKSTPDKGAGVKYRVSSLNQLTNFQFISSDKLIRLSKNDFWRLGEDGDGHFIERLVSDDDGPIKEG